MWKELGIPSGHAYTKAFRTCKSCVGTDFCRYGLGDSIALAQKIERRYQGVESPHKMKLATAGCPRNCSEAYVKDLGAVAIGDGKWEIYIGGAAGGTVRKGDLLCTVEGHEQVLTYMGRFIQYYRENAKYLERTYGFAERVGIEHLRAVLIEDTEGICERLDAEIDKAVAAYRDPCLQRQSSPRTSASLPLLCRLRPRLGERKLSNEPEPVTQPVPHIGPIGDSRPLAHPAAGIDLGPIGFIPLGEGARIGLKGKHLPCSVNATGVFSQLIMPVRTRPAHWPMGCLVPGR